MQCDVLTLFPELISGVLSQSILGRAHEKGLVHIRVHDLRGFIDDVHRMADDAPYGGGAGMVMKAEPVFRAVECLQAEGTELRVILPSPQGIPFTQRIAQDLSAEGRRIVWVCGHYEGFDERVFQHLHPEEISIGDYVLTGGELPALVMIDAAVRLVPGVLGDPESAQQDSFVESLLDFPHFTRPAGVRGQVVPDVLRSGNHEAIRVWRRKEALRNTYVKRPDLLEQHHFTPEDTNLLAEVIQEQDKEKFVGSEKER
ncbi:MAG: tRNA (guanosine(37)-N1)-methyltransferase TrmD [Nitrospirales bacterium]|nr:tRNA (guanosine(37)-N1)-methyltransferase TrmD [Nitrospirales bacterium]